MNSIIANTQDAAGFADGSKKGFIVALKHQPLEGWDMKKIETERGVFFEERKDTQYIVPWTKSPYQIGKPVYVREAWLQGHKMEDDEFVLDELGEPIEQLWYKAQSPNLSWYDGTSDYPRENAPWLSPATMPRTAARTWITPTSVKCVRVG